MTNQLPTPCSHRNASKRQWKQHASTRKTYEGWMRMRRSKDWRPLVVVLGEEKGRRGQ